MSGVGKTTAARAVARRYDLWFYSLGSRTYAHAEAVRSPTLEQTADELWVERTPELMAEDFENAARERFPYVLLDVGSIPDDARRSLRKARSCCRASSELERSSSSPRPSSSVSSSQPAARSHIPRRPERALANRVRRDELLAGRLRSTAEVVEISDVSETESVVEGFVREHATAWLTRADRGDVSARRRDENDRRLDQWGRYAAHEPRARKGTVDFACECDRAGCTEVVQLEFADASRTPRLAH